MKGDDGGNGSGSVASVLGGSGASTQRKTRSRVTPQVGGSQASKAPWERLAMGCSGANVQIRIQNSAWMSIFSF